MPYQGRAGRRDRRRWGLALTGLFCLATGLAGCTPSADGAGDPVRPAAVEAPGPRSSSVSSSPAGVIAFSTLDWGHVLLADSAGAALTEVPLGPAVGPVDLAPDGSRLAVTVATPTGATAVVVSGVDGTAPQTFPASRRRSLLVGGWSADSRLVSVADVSDRRANGIVVLDPRTGALRRVTTAPGRTRDYPAAWSPDGRWLAFTRSSDEDANWYVGDLYVVSSSGGTPVRLNPPDTTVRDYYISPASFFPDSRRIAFVAAFNKRTVWGITYSSARLYVADVDGRHLRPVTRYRDWATSTRVSPDGQWLVYDHAPRNSRAHLLYLVHPDGTGEHPVEGSPPGSVGAVWSPDGASLLAAVDGDGANNLVVVPLGGGAVTPLTRAGGMLFAHYSWARSPRP